MPESANDRAVAELADRTWREMLQHSPVWGTFLGIEVDDGALDDVSDDARIAERERWERAAWAAAAIGDEDLSVDGRITDRKSTRLNSSHSQQSRMPSSA